MSTAARLRSLLASDPARAAGMGFAVVTAMVATLLFTVVFARVLGPDGYGELGALVSAFLILLIPGSALQISVARELSVNPGRETERMVAHGVQRIALLTVPVAAISFLLAKPTAAALNVDAEWAAGSIVPSAWLWLLVSVQRGVLQGVASYRLVGLSLIGEAAGRLGFGLILYAAGLGVTGVFLGNAASLLITAVVLQFLLNARLEAGGRARGEGASGFAALVVSTWLPMAALSLVAVMQNVDLIVVKHQASDAVAGVYAAASLSAKVIVWVAVGLGFYLLPEAARRWNAGEDTRRLLIQVLVLMAAASGPVIALYAVAGGPLLTAVFGSDYEMGATYLVWLALAMSLLAFTYLSVQHLLSRGRTLFVWLLLVAAVGEPVLLLSFGDDALAIATALAALQFALAAAILTVDLRSGTQEPP